jgi:hypothetical protein
MLAITARTHFFEPVAGGLLPDRPPGRQGRGSNHELSRGQSLENLTTLKPNGGLNSRA